MSRLANSIPGISPRWSEHCRELSRHLDGTVPADRRRRRYQVLKTQQPSSCLNFIILDSCGPNEIATREAVAITRILPHANGSELKHLSETFRTRRNRGKRNRISKSNARRNRRAADIRLESLQWDKKPIVMPDRLMQHKRRTSSSVSRGTLARPPHLKISELTYHLPSENSTDWNKPGASPSAHSFYTALHQSYYSFVVVLTTSSANGLTSLRCFNIKEEPLTIAITLRTFVATSPRTS